VVCFHNTVEVTQTKILLIFQHDMHAVPSSTND